MKTMQDLKFFLLERFPKEHIYLFGSRARGDASAYSDIDIAIESSSALSSKLSQVRFELEESLIPYKVDLVELSKAPYLRDIIKKEGVKWH
jgi:predicted nucleotidyltransferase